jgi:hypothetical protein
MTSAPTSPDRPEQYRYYGNERRSANRYHVESSVEYRIVDGAPAFEWKRGSVRNLSANGVLIDVGEALPVDCTLEAAMDWPWLYHGRPVVRLVLFGRLVRLDGRSAALRIVTHEFRNLHPDALRSPECSVR